MKEKIEDINFNLPPKMVKILIDFNNLKKEISLKIKKLESKLIKKRNLFIKEFRLNNLNEIKAYLEFN